MEFYMRVIQKNVRFVVILVYRGYVYNFITETYCVSTTNILFLHKNTHALLKCAALILTRTHSLRHIIATHEIYERTQSEMSTCRRYRQRRRKLYARSKAAQTDAIIVSV